MRAICRHKSKEVCSCEDEVGSFVVWNMRTRFEEGSVRAATCDVGGVNNRSVCTSCGTKVGWSWLHTAEHKEKKRGRSDLDIRGVGVEGKTSKVRYKFTSLLSLGKALSLKYSFECSNIKPLCVQAWDMGFRKLRKLLFRSQRQMMQYQKQ